EKNSAILVADGRKQSAILDAEASKAAMILQAEAERESAIRRAEGEAEAILKIQQATADGIRMINEAKPGEGVIAIKSLEALEKVADGQSTKIIIPSEIQGLAGLVTSATELAKK
ncbi:MAG: peptidase, partial [Clostridia bacterium]|nr:peptidase [Clostridia bacterium]